MLPRLSPRSLIPLTVVVLLLPACGDSADDSADTTLAPTTTTEPTTTTTEPTTTEAVEVLSLRLTFDGESCIYEGPTVLAAGPVDLLFVNESESYATADIRRLTGDKSLQDMIDYMGDPPSPYDPPWAENVSPWQRLSPGKTSTWEGNLEAGIHITMCIEQPGGSAFGAYFATGLTVEP